MPECNLGYLGTSEAGAGAIRLHQGIKHSMRISVIDRRLAPGIDEQPSGQALNPVNNETWKFKTQLYDARLDCKDGIVRR